jgi:hypothetical protein
MLFLTITLNKYFLPSIPSSFTYRLTIIHSQLIHPSSPPFIFQSSIHCRFSTHFSPINIHTSHSINTLSNFVVNQKILIKKMGQFHR